MNYCDFILGDFIIVPHVYIMSSDMKMIVIVLFYHTVLSSGICTKAFLIVWLPW